MMETKNNNWENQIRHLALELDYPPTPDLITSVRQRLVAESSAAQPRQPLARPWYASRLAWVAAVILVLAALLAVVPQTRAAIIDFFQIGDIRLFPDDPAVTPEAEESSALDSTPETGETAVPTPTVSAAATAANPFADLYGQTTLAELEATFDDAILLPEYPKGIGLPDEVYYQTTFGMIGIQVWYETAEKQEILAVLYTLILEEGAFGGKASFQLESMTVTEVNGQEAYWVEGEHLLRFYDERGRIEPRMTRFVEGSTLIWTEGPVTYRLETALPLEEAIRMAESMQ